MATMNRAATAGVLLALFTGTVSAQDGAYFGIGAGRSTYDTQINANRAVERTYDEIPLAPLDPGGSISEAARESDGSNKDDAWKLYGGYRFNRHFAVEGAYVDLGNTGGQVITLGVEGSSPSPTGVEGLWRGNTRTWVEYESQNIAVSGKGILPLGRSFELFGKVGATYYRNKSLHRWAVSANQTTDAGLVQYEDGRGNSSNDSGVSWLFGLGAAIHFWERYAVNLEYESFQGMQFGPDKDSIDMLSLSLEFRL